MESIYISNKLLLTTLIALLGNVSLSFAQVHSHSEDSNRKKSESQIFIITEEPAQPKGGMSSFYKWVNSEMKYPKKAKKKGIEGKVYIQFTVEKDGSISNVKAVKGIGGGCDEEAVRIMASSSKWRPSKDKGRAKAKQMVLPITFKLP